MKNENVEDVQEYLSYQEELYLFIESLSEEEKATFQPHELNLLAEYKQVFTWYRNLEIFANNGDFQQKVPITNQQKFWLSQQYTHMTGYVDVLSLRINEFISVGALEDEEVPEDDGFRDESEIKE